MLQKFEKDGHLYSFGELEKQNGIAGHWVNQAEWNHEEKCFYHKNRLFVPERGWSNITRQNVLDSFKLGSYFVYLQKKLKKKERKIVNKLCAIIQQ